jgi:hypothetical protein
VIALVWAALKARKRVAVITMLLAAFAAAAAAAGPLYGAAARRVSHAEEVAAAPPEARTLIANHAHLENAGTVGTPFSLPYLPGFQTLHGFQILGVVRDWDPSGLALLASRTNYCAHVTVVKGRCAVADREVIVREDTSDRLHLPPGTDLSYRVGLTGNRTVDTQLTVVGTYRAIDPADPFWAQRSEFLEATGGPIFATDRTLSLASPVAGETADVVGSTPGFDDTARLAGMVARERERLTAAGYNSADGLDAFIDALNGSDRLLRNSMIVAVLPLILLSWLVLFLAVTGAVAQRREELGLVALRGVPAQMRWLLLSLETALPVLAGAVPGYLLGYAAVATLVPGQAVAPNAASVGYTAVAIGGALAAGVAAQLGALRLPVLELLRRTRSGRRPAARRLAEAIAGALAVAAGVQVVLAGDSANGMGLLAPLGFALGLGLLAARLLTRPAERLGRSALRRGWARIGVVALALARRPGTSATVVLLTVVFGLLGFAFTAADVAQRAWQQRAVVEVGADRVVAVAPVPVPQLLEAVRKVDPAGDFAMATARVDTGSSIPVLAVDSARLNQVVPWLADPALPGLLRPREPQPFLVRGKELVLAVKLTAEPDAALALGLRFVTAAGGRFSAETTQLQPGWSSYPVALPQCAESACRLEEVELKYELRRMPVRLVLGVPQEWADPGRWVKPTALPGAPDMTLSGTPEGLALDAEAGASGSIFPASLPRPLPMVGSGTLPREITGYVGAVVYPVASAGMVPMVPRYGGSGALADLGYTDLAPTGGGDASKPEIWLNSKAPADIEDRLRAAGLTIVDRRSAADEAASLRSRAPALALRFLVAAAIAGLVLGAGGVLVLAALEREERDRGLAVLRAQGVRGSILGVAAIGTRWAALLLSVVVGLCAAAVSWWLAHAVLPVFTDSFRRVPPPALPGWENVVYPASIALAVLAVVCVVAARMSERGAR